ncbi:hypothetical protein ANANG_G00269850 [Anguilla anguilla]|uniref:NF-kappa-B inhibitor-like protein 2 n=1 Tax=Anguilla anguilla TaxID=7936 RepID=A0A9D3LQR8_ANGAN|nr:hypothetical protein ANANG_G00269850 [Anguilla anguilla]
MSLSGKPENEGETHSTDRKRVQVERSGSPAPSCVSVKSESSMDYPFNLKGESTGDQRVQVERSGSPAPSYVSLKSESSMDYPFNLKGESTGDQRIHQSLDSSCFDDKTSQLFFPKQSLLRTLMKLNKDEKLKLFENHLSQDCPECFESLSEDPCAVDKFMMMSELLKSHKIHDYPECTEREQVDPKALYIVEKMLETCGSERSLKITLHILRNMKEKDLANSLEREQRNESIKRAQRVLKTYLRKTFVYLYESLNHPTLLNEIYTDLYITEGGGGGVNDEHEIRQIETASKRHTTQETAILCNDIFKPLPGQEKPRTVLTKGIAGIGKTVSVQKFILDWAEGKANQDIDFVFTLPFRDLNLKKETAFSLMQLLQHYFPQLKEIKTFEGDEVKVLFILDGLDECRLPLNFQSNKICCDMTKVLSVDVLLTNLIKGNLFPSALLWITSRPAAANQIPLECVHQVTEVRGFNDPQKEEYFRKRIRDEKQASRIISHIRSSRSLYIMCHIPVFCWISAVVLETMLGETESGDLPTTLTEMYTHFLLIQTYVKNQKYHGTIGTNPKKMSESDRENIMKLGKLAFVQLVKGNLIFYEEDLRESGIDVTEASVYSGVCTEIFKEEYGLYQEKVFCFVHLSIQEYLAALFAFYSCVNENRNVLRAEESKPHSDRVQMSELHRSAVDQALESKNGQLDLFLRFLLGLSLDSVKTLLGELLTQTISRSSVPGLQTQTGSRSSVPGLQTQTGSRSSVPDPQTGIRSPLPGPKTQTKRRSSVSDLQTQTVRRSSVPDLQTQTGCRTPGPDAQAQTESRSENIEETVKYIKKKISEESSAERIINLFRCLSELNDNTLVEEIQNCLRSRKLLDKVLEPHQCSALAFVLLMSEEVLAEFDLKTYNTTAAGHQRLVPVVRNCRKAILISCDLTQKSCDVVASALQSSNSTLRDLDLSYNNLGDAGVKLLCTGLMSPKCKLQRLGLISCDLTEKSCDIVASALQSSSSPLRDLDLSYNDLGDSGVKLLCAGLMSPKCKLERLGLGWCNLTEGCCDILASVLRSPHSELRDLELRDNELKDSGVRALSAGLEDPHCKLQRLGLSGCRVTQRGFDSLASALCSNPSHLRELDLSYNHPIFSKLRALLATKLDTLTLLADCRGEHRTKPGPRKYGCQLTLDPNTANRELSLSEGNRKGRLPDPTSASTKPAVIVFEVSSGKSIATLRRGVRDVDAAFTRNVWNCNAVSLWEWICAAALPQSLAALRGERWSGAAGGCLTQLMAQSTNTADQQPAGEKTQSRIEASCLELALEGERLCKAGDFKGGTAFFEAAVRVGTEDLKTLSAIYSQLGNAYFYLKEYAKALEYHRHDLTLARTIGDRTGEGKASGNLGNTLKILGRFDEAVVCCQRHLDISQEQGDKVAEARALYNLGNVFHARGKQQAMNLSLVKELGDRAAQGRAYGNLGNAHYLLGNFIEAIKFHQERLAIAKEFGDKAAERRAYSNLGNALIFLGQFKTATEYYRKTLQLSHQLKDRAMEAQACYSLGNTYTLLQQHDRAVDHHLKHLHIAQELRDRIGEGRACWSLGNAYMSLGNHRQALHYTRKHLDISREIGDRSGELTARVNVKRLMESLGAAEGDLSPCGSEFEVQGARPKSSQRSRRDSVDLCKSRWEKGQNGHGCQDVDAQSRGARGQLACPIRRKGHADSQSDGRRWLDWQDSPVDTEDITVQVTHPKLGRGPSGEDCFFDLLSKFQSSRMDDQRCRFDEPPDGEEDPCSLLMSPQAEELFDLIASSQSRRLDDQREPGDDFFNMLIKCQSSRIDDQRCSPPARAPWRRRCRTKTFSA